MHGLFLDFYYRDMSVFSATSLYYTLGPVLYFPVLKVYTAEVLDLSFSSCLLLNETSGCPLA